MVNDAPQRPLEPAEIAKLGAEAQKFQAEARRLDAEAARFAAETAKVAAETEARQHDAQRSRAELERFLKDRALADAGNLEHRVYEFTDSVHRSSAETAIQVLSRWRRMSKEPILIRFSSPGGSVLDGLGLFDYIQALRRDGILVTTAALGMAASMACILLQAGDKRLMADNAYILIHEVSAGAVGKISELEDETKFIRRLNQRLYDILASRSNISRRKIELRAKRKDWWLDPQEALKLGLCDGIGYQ